MKKFYTLLIIFSLLLIGLGFIADKVLAENDLTTSGAWQTDAEATSDLITGTNYLIQELTTNGTDLGSAKNWKLKVRIPSLPDVADIIIMKGTGKVVSLQFDSSGTISDDYNVGASASVTPLADDYYLLDFDNSFSFNSSRVHVAISNRYNTATDGVQIGGTSSIIGDFETARVCGNNFYCDPGTADSSVSYMYFVLSETGDVPSFFDSIEVTDFAIDFPYNNYTFENNIDYIDTSWTSNVSFSGAVWFSIYNDTNQTQDIPLTRWGGSTYPSGSNGQTITDTRISYLTSGDTYTISAGIYYLEGTDVNDIDDYLVVDTATSSIIVGSGSELETFFGDTDYSFVQKTSPTSNYPYVEIDYPTASSTSKIPYLVADVTVDSQGIGTAHAILALVSTSTDVTVNPVALYGTYLQAGSWFGLTRLDPLEGSNHFDLQGMAVDYSSLTIGETYNVQAFLIKKNILGSSTVVASSTIVNFNYAETFTEGSHAFQDSLVIQALGNTFPFSYIYDFWDAYNSSRITSQDTEPLYLTVEWNNNPAFGTSTWVILNDETLRENLGTDNWDLIQKWLSIFIYLGLTFTIIMTVKQLLGIKSQEIEIDD